MERDKISLRDGLTLLFVALLPSLVRILPRDTGEIAGKAAWLTPLLALLPLLVMLAVLSWAFRRLPEEAGLGELYQIAFGIWPGRILAGITGLWLWLLAAEAYRFFAERFVASIYPEVSLWLFTAVLGGLAAWICLGKLGALCRMGRVFFYAVSVALAGMLLLSLPKLRIYNVWPVWVDDLPGAVASMPPLLATLGYGILAALLGGHVLRQRNGQRQAFWWILVYCLMLAVLSAAVLAVFGPDMSTRLQQPLFALAKEIGIPGAIERVESVMTAVWMCTDVALVPLLLLTGWKGVRLALGSRGKQTWAAAVALLLIPTSVYMTSSVFALEKFHRRITVPGTLILAYLLPLLAAAVAKLRQRL